MMSLTHCLPPLFLKMAGPATGFMYIFL